MADDRRHATVLNTIFVLFLCTQVVCYQYSSDQQQHTYGLVVSTTALTITTFGLPTLRIADTCALIVAFLNFPLMLSGRTIGSDLLHNTRVRFGSVA